MRNAALIAVILGTSLATPLLAQQPPAARPPAPTSDATRAAPAERIGGANPRVVIEEYADFQCPYCAEHDRQFGDSVYRWVRAQKGAVRFDFYDVALRQHPAAAPAAHAARCAGEQGGYDAARRAIFAGQKEWGQAWDAAERATRLARATVKDTAAFDRCVAADATALYATLAANMARGRALGIPGTPTFVIRIGERTAQIVDPVSADSIAKVVKSLEARR